MYFETDFEEHQYDCAQKLIRIVIEELNHLPLDCDTLYLDCYPYGDTKQQQIRELIKRMDFHGLLNYEYMNKLCENIDLKFGVFRDENGPVYYFTKVNEKEKLYRK